MRLSVSRKLLTKREPQAIENVWSTSVSATPSAAAFSRSTLILNVGLSSWPLGRTCARPGSCAAIWSSWLRACISLSWPRPPRSSSSKSKPDEVPRRRIDRRDGRILVRAELLRDPADQRLHGKVRRGALAPVLELHEYLALVLPTAREVVSVHDERGGDRLALLLEQLVADVVERDPRALLRRPGRRLHLHEKISLVLVRQERGGQVDEQPSHGRDHRGIDREEAARVRDDAP